MGDVIAACLFPTHLLKKNKQLSDFSVRIQVYVNQPLKKTH